MPPNFFSRLVKAPLTNPPRERSESSVDLPQPKSPSIHRKSPSTPNHTALTSRPPSLDIPSFPSNFITTDLTPTKNLKADNASIRTTTSSTGLSVTIVPPSPRPEKLLRLDPEQDILFPHDHQQPCSDPDIPALPTSGTQELNISPRLRTISAPSPRSSPTEDILMTPKPDGEKSPSRSRPSSPSNFASLKQRLKKSTSNLSLAPSSEMRRKSSNKSLKQVPAPISIPARATASTPNGSSEVPPVPPLPATVNIPVVASPDRIRSGDELMTQAQSAPVLQAVDSNSSSLGTPKRDSDAASIASAGSQAPKRRPWRGGSSNSRKPSGLAGAIAASGLAMANPTMSQAHRNVSLVQVTESNGIGTTRKLSGAAPASASHTFVPQSPQPSHVKSQSADLTLSPTLKGSPVLPTRRRTTPNTSIYGDNASEYYAEGTEYLELDADSGLDDSRSGSESDSDLDLGEGDIPVTGFAVASNKRNADFHELFPTIPEGDYLIEDYGCALQREILIQGRLYVSENHICFHANIFGWITDLSIPIYDITSLEKKMTAFVIPNGIQISTRNAKYTFASFLSRDTTFDVIYNIWRHARPDDSASVFSSTRGSLDAPSAERATQPNGIPKAVNRVTLCRCGQDNQHYAEVAMDVVVPGTPDRIHNLVFASGFLKDFLTREQKLIDIQVSDWTPIEPGSRLLARNMSYIRPLNGSLGPKQTKCEIRDETIHADPEDYLTMMTTTRTPDVPSGGVFSVKTRTCIMWASAITTRIIVSTQVEWTGRSFIKGIIDKSAIDGQRVYHTELEKAMRAYIQEHQSEFVPAGIDPSVIELAESAAAQEGEKAGPTQRLSEEAEWRKREHERNRRGLQWAWDTIDGAYQVAKRSTRGALELIRDAWDQSTTTTILWFVIVILVFSNVWTLARMEKKNKIGRRKDIIRAEEHDRLLQGVMGALRDELVSKVQQQQPLMGVLPADLGSLPPVGSLSWHTEVAQLRNALDSVEERVKSLQAGLNELAMADTAAALD